MAEVVEGDGYGDGFESSDIGLEIHEDEYFLFIIAAGQNGPLLILRPLSNTPCLLLDM